MRPIALFLPNWIGDVVMATPAIRAVRERFPDRRLLGVCKPYVADTIAGSPWFDGLVLFDKRGPKSQRFLAVAAELRRQRVGTAVLFPNSFRTALLVTLAGCQEIVGYARYGRDMLLSHRLYPQRGRYGRPKPTPVIDDYNRLVEAIGVTDPGHKMELHTTVADELQANKVCERLGLTAYPHWIGINPGGAFGAAKHWPSTYFAEVARELVGKPGHAVVVLCGPAERETARQIVNEAAHPAVFSLADVPVSLGLTKAVVRRLRLLISTDSGPRHFAPAFNVPVVSLFGPTHIEWTITYFPDETHLQKRLPCGPCQQRVCPLQHHRCMTELLPGEVLVACDRMLSLTGPTHSQKELLRHAG